MSAGLAYAIVPPGRCCIMQLYPPGHICICSCVHPRAKPSFPFFFLHVMIDMGNVQPLGIRCNHKTKYVNIHAAYIHVRIGSVHARSLTRAHTLHVQSCTCPRFLHSPGHDCICISVRSGQYCMADTIASDTGVLGKSARRLICPPYMGELLWDEGGKRALSEVVCTQFAIWGGGGEVNTIVFFHLTVW